MPGFRSTWSSGSGRGDATSVGPRDPSRVADAAFRGIDSRFGFAVIGPPVRHGIERRGGAPVVPMYALAHAVTRAFRRAGTNRVSKGLH